MDCFGLWHSNLWSDDTDNQRLCVIKGKTNYVSISLYPKELKFLDKLSKATGLPADLILKILLKKLMTGDIKIEVDLRIKGDS